MSDTGESWVLRYTATTLGFPDWRDAEPARLALVTNHEGSSQAWAHDLASGSWRQLSAEPIGVEALWMLPDGRVAWWQDLTGAERGRLIGVGFEGGEPEPVFPEVPDGWLMGLSFEAGRAALGVEVDGEYRVYVVDADGTTRLLRTSPAPIQIGSYGSTRGGLSADGSLLCMAHADDGDILHFGLRVIDVATGETVGELRDPGRHLVADAWSPVPGDRRLLFTSELGDFERPAIWDLATGERRDIAVDLPGGVFPMQWWPGEDALLARHEFEGRGQLVKLHAVTGAATALTDLAGDLEGGARMRPDGEVWFHVSDAVHPSRVAGLDGNAVILAPGELAPAGRAYVSRYATNPEGERIHMLVVTPEGAGPFPTVLNIHGGPEWHERDRFDPETQAFVDNGYAVALVNYRGSTGYGIAFREALIGNVCHAESEDIVACLDALIADGTTDAEHVYWSGWSWGGCLACFNAGVNPERFRAIFAGIPAGDFVAAHWASAPELQAWDDAVYGGSPEDAPESYRRSDPMSYVERVKAPVIVIAGEHDPRCPIEGVTPWVDAVRAHGGEVEVHTYSAGHHTNEVEAKVQEMRWVLEFFARHR